MALLTLVEPTSEPITLAQMKQFARVDFPDDDTLWPTLMASARHWCEVYCQRRFMLRTMRLEMDFFPGYVDFKMAGQKVSSPFVSGQNAVLVGIRYAIQLPYPQVRGIIALRYLDANGNQQTMTGAPAATPTETGFQYLYDIDSQPARLTPNVQAGQMWPVALVTPNAVQCDYLTGYGGNIMISVTASSAAVTGYQFNSSMVGLPLTVPGAGADAQPLVTTLAAVDGSGNGTMATPAVTSNPTAFAYLGEPVPQMIQVAIMRLANYYYENRVSSPDKDFLASVKQLLGPFRDLRL